MALIVLRILFIMAPNEGESTVFRRISSTTYRPTNFFNSPPLTCFAPKSRFCCLDEVEAVALLAALCLTPPGSGTELCCDSKCFFKFNVVFLKLDSTLSPAQSVKRTLIISSLADTNTKYWPYFLLEKAHLSPPSNVVCVYVMAWCNTWVFLMLTNMTGLRRDITPRDTRRKQKYIFLLRKMTKIIVMHSDLNK